MNFGRWKKKSDDDSSRPGKVGLLVVLGLASLSLMALGGTWLVRNAARTIEADAGPWSLRETDRVVTGQQRVDRVAFAPGGDRLAGICPRYNTLLIFGVDPAGTLKPAAETQLDGRPVGVVALGSRFVVLERPAGDARHTQPGWWEVFDRGGKRIGARHEAGYYPDDLSASPDGHRLFVLSSGRGEGDPGKPPGALEVIDIRPEDASSRTLGRITFNATDDPERLTVSASSRYAAVLLAKTRRTLAVDLSDPAAPRMIGKTAPAAGGAPYVSASEDDDWIMMPTGSDGDTIALEAPGSGRDDRTPHPDYLVTSSEMDSSLEIFQTKPQHQVGRFPLFGPFNLGRTRPTGLAYSPERHLIAVATRTGSIHVVEMRTR